MNVVKFECRSMPGLMIDTNGRRYQFRGGVLDVQESEANDVRLWALKRQHLGIREVGIVETEADTSDDREVTPEVTTADEPPAPPKRRTTRRKKAT